MRAIIVVAFLLCVFSGSVWAEDLTYCNEGINAEELQRKIELYTKCIITGDLSTKNMATAYNNKAWLLATAPSSRDRNGKEAVQAALKAVQLDDDADNRDTLAAAYAEAGQFSNAIAGAEKAIEMARAEGRDDIADFESRLELYRQQKPYHQEPN